jgi:DNA-binding CsgD family transcriptional regulator/type II secretory pathway predicted ATPase ExeA
MIGRAPHLTALRTSLRMVGTGTAAYFVTGPSGAGKTHFIRTAGQILHQDGAVVLSGACPESGGIPLAPLREALRRVRLPQGARGTHAVARLRAMLDGAGAPDADGLIEEISSGLSELAGKRTLVLAVDDLQWVDRTSARALRHLVAGLGGPRLLLVGAFRVDSPHVDPTIRAMLNELRRLPSARVDSLPPLTPSETLELAAMVLGRAPREDESQRLLTLSARYPFLVEELASAMREGDPDGPTTVAEIAQRRLAALPPDALAVAVAVAAGVEPVETRLLAKVLGFDEARLARATAACVRRRILDLDDDGYSFHLNIYKEALRRDPPPTDTVALNRRYAEALASTAKPIHLSRLAHHWRLAGETCQALVAARLAARYAERRYGYPEALTGWSAALEIIEEAREGALPFRHRRLAWQQAAEAAYHSGDHERALALIDDLAGRMLGPLPGWLHTQRARYLAALGRIDEADAEYRLAVSSADGDPRARAIAAAHWADLLLQLGRYADAGSRAEEALALTRHLRGMISTEVLANATLGFSQAWRDDHQSGRAALQAAIDTAVREGRPSDVARAYLHMAELLTGPLNELAEGVAVARRGADIAAEKGLGRSEGARLLAVAANGMFRKGEWFEAERVLEQAMLQKPSSNVAAEVLLAKVRISLGCGDFSTAEEDLDRVHALTFGGSPRYVVAMYTLRAGLAMWREKPDEARGAVQQGLELFEGRSDDIVAYVTLLWHGLRAEAEARNSDTSGVDTDVVRRLRELVDEARKAALPPTPPVREAVEGFLALCDAESSRIDDERDPTPWDHAAKLWHSRGHPYPETYARLRQAEALMSQPTRDPAAEGILRWAFKQAQALHARPLTHEIRSLADRARMTLEGTGAERPTELADLTEREIVVLQFVAQGLSNEEIAERLYISHRTVGVHVSNILRKLRVERRGQAGALYARLMNRDDAGLGQVS